MNTRPCTIAQLNRLRPHKNPVAYANAYAVPGLAKKTRSKKEAATVNRADPQGYLDTISYAVSYATGVPVEEITAKNRETIAVFARHLMCFIASEYYAVDPSHISIFLGGNRSAYYSAKTNVPEWIKNKDEKLLRAMPRLLKWIPQVKHIFADLKIEQ